MNEAVSILKELLDEFEKLSFIVKRERELTDSANENSSAENIILSEDRRTILKRLTELTGKLRNVRKWWQNFDLEERNKFPEINKLIQRAQNLAFLILNCDRENEQKLLKIGKVPLNHLPPAQKQAPNYVAKLYKKNVNF